MFIQTNAYFAKISTKIFFAPLSTSQLPSATFFNLVTRDNQHAIDLFFIILFWKPHVWLNWQDYYNANKYIFLGLKSMEKQKVTSQHGTF